MNCFRLLLLMAPIALASAFCGCNKEAETKSKHADVSPKKSDAELLAEAELDADKQQYIWDSEHVTFKIEKLFGGSYLERIDKSKVEELVDKFLDSAQCFTMEAEPHVYSKSGFVEKVTKLHDDHYRSIPVSELLKRHAEIRKTFASFTRKSFRVLHIDQDKSDPKKWTTEVYISLIGKSPEGLPLQFESYQDVVFVIENEDELDELAAVTSWKVKKEVERSASQWMYQEITSDAKLDKVLLPDNWSLEKELAEQYRFQIALEDFDSDGRQDIAVACLQFPTMLLRQLPDGTFRDVANDVGLATDRPLPNYACAWFDLENDGDPDLVMGNLIFRNDGGKFVDITMASKLKIDAVCMGAVVADYDLDGLVDLYFLYQVDYDDRTKKLSKWVDEENSGKANQLWKNLGDGTFQNVTIESKSGGGARHTHAASWFHLDGDRFPDLYIANDLGRNVLLRNKGDGTFENVSDESGTAGFSTSMGVATGDLNNDGKNEIYVANMFSKMGRRIIAHVSESDYPKGIYEQIVGSCSGNQLYTPNVSGSDGDGNSVNGKGFREIGEETGVHSVGWAFAPAMLDYDNDGLLDLYSTAGFMSFSRTKPDG